MGACFYVLYTQFKNRIKERMKHPSFWIAALVVVAYFVFYFLQVMDDVGESHIIHDAVNRFHCTATVVCLSFTFLAMNIGIKRGSSIFRPADIRMMFVSPITPNRILMYGVMRQFSASIIATLFLVMQLINLRIYFGFWIKELIIIMLAWFMLSVSCSISSIAIYSLTATRPRLRRFTLVVMYLLLGIIIGGLTVFIIRGTDIEDSIIRFSQNPILHQVPIGGWTAGFLDHALDGEYPYALLYASLTLFLPLLGVFMVSRTRSDYYEDVLTSTGNLYAYAHPDGVVDSSAWTRKNVSRNSKKPLYGKRKGSAVFLQRQLTEQRRSLFLLFDRTSLILVAVSILMGGVFYRLRLKGMYPQVMEVFSIVILSYVLFFTVTTGRMTDEFSKPYIYLVPSRPVKKLLYCSMASVYKAFFEGVVCFSMVALFARLSPLFIACATVFYASSALFFASAYLTSLRALNLDSSRNMRLGLTLVIITAMYIFEFSLGNSVGVSINNMSSFLFPLTFLVLAGVNLIVSFVFFNCAKGMLEDRK